MTESLASLESDVQKLQKRVLELEHQLANAEATLQALNSPLENSTLHHFDLIFAYSRDVMLFIQRDNGRILDANAAAVQAYGYSQAELLALTIQDLRAPDTKILTGEQMAQADSKGILFETVHRRKDGSIFPVEVSSQGTSMGGERILISVIRDISERKQTEKEIAEFSRKLESSNQDLEQFAFVASHDLQEPLRKIEGFGDALLQRSTQLEERDRDYLERMRNAASRMRNMIDGLLQLSRVNTLGQPFERVDLSGVTAEVLADLEHQVRRTGGKVEVSPLPTIQGDPLQLRQLMQNLIGNALKFHRPEMPPLVKVSARKFEVSEQIIIEDNGIGFNPKEIERIFQPGQRLVGRSQFEGSGMGLALCRRIVERHGGEITARSEPGRGSVFIVSLPVRN